MSTHQDIRPDGTVVFLPHRLNRHPVVVRGRSAAVGGVWAGGWAAGRRGVGVARAFVFSTIAIVPTAIMLGIAAGVFAGGGMLRRQKRGRPDTWLYRQLQWRIAQRHPALASFVGAHALVIRSGYWSTRRSKAA